MSFRAQLALPEHRQLFDYWLERQSDSQLPMRKDFNPVDFPRLLPGISLIDVDDDISKCRVRLAGTRLRDVFDREITGMQINDLDWGDRRSYWLTAYEHTVTKCMPTQGVVRGPRVHKEHLVQYWLKLPLSTSDGQKVDMILCHDQFMPAAMEVERERMARLA